MYNHDRKNRESIYFLLQIFTQNQRMGMMSRWRNKQIDASRKQAALLALVAPCSDTGNQFLVLEVFYGLFQTSWCHQYTRVTRFKFLLDITAAADHSSFLSVPLICRVIYRLLKKKKKKISTSGVVTYSCNGNYIW